MLPELQSAKTLSEFQKRVFSTLMLVPEGKVTTYAALAESIGCASPRAIGQALRSNPFAPDIPCHRVVRSDGSVGGFFGSHAPALTARKTALLTAEGVAIDAAGRIPDRFILRSLKKGLPPHPPLPAAPCGASQ